MKKLSPAEIEHVKAITNSGELYYDYDPLIEAARNYAYSRCRSFNSRFLKQGELDQQILRELFAETGTNLQIEFGFITEFGFNLHIGNNFRAGKNLKIIDCNQICIGDNVILGDNVGLYTSNHAFDSQKRADHWCSELPIEIGTNSILESNVVVTPGTKIGHDCLVKAGSIVVKDVADGAIVSGDPAQ